MAPDGETLGHAALAALLAAGADEAQVVATETDKTELNAEWNEPSLLRSTVDARLSLVALVDGKKGVSSSTDTSPEGVERAAAQAVMLARGSRPDPANDIAPAQPAASYEAGGAEPDLDRMHHRMVELLEHRRQAHPRTTLRSVVVDHSCETRVLLNSAGVSLRSRVGAYTFAAAFSARRGADTSSFNFTVAQARDLDRPIATLGSFDRLLRDSALQLDPSKPPDKFVGDLVVTPDCLVSFLDPLAGYLQDDALISGTSVLASRLGEAVAHPTLTVRSAPRADHMAVPCFFTRDGHVTEDTTVIRAGRLEQFLLSRFGARKTGHPRAATDGGAWVVDAGTEPLEALIGGVERGVLLCRFSGGRPSPSGEFSGIAKNSFLIEDGRIGPALAETMVSGNLLQLLLEVRGISRERVDFGDRVLPWVRLPGATIS